jgi:hypothetical protein
VSSSRFVGIHTMPDRRLPSQRGFDNKLSTARFRQRGFDNEVSPVAGRRSPIDVPRGRARADG